MSFWFLTFWLNLINVILISYYFCFLINAILCILKCNVIECNLIFWIYTYTYIQIHKDIIEHILIYLNILFDFKLNVIYLIK